jgi:diguanylate cyclase (GGDEF)-like protein
VLTATDELGEAAVRLDRFFASGADHDRSAFAAHARRVDAAFVPLLDDTVELGGNGDHLVGAAWSSWQFVRDTVTDPAFAVPEDPQARTGLLATLSTALTEVRGDLRGLSESASRDVADLAGDAQRTATGMQIALGGGLALAVVLGAVTLGWLVRDLRRGLGALLEGAHRMTDGALDHRVREDLPGDLAPVAHAFNAMAARIQAQRSELHGLASNDGLTGLLNRRAFQDELEAELERSTRYGHRTAVLLLDVDHFKRVNDTLGHPAGDAVLQAVAEQVTAAVRGVDRVARWGGEEFAILLPETEEQAARRVAERVVDLVGRRVVLVGGQRVQVTVSVGVAVHDPLERAVTTADQLVDLADGALYEAKGAGRNRACFASVPA